MIGHRFDVGFERIQVEQQRRCRHIGFVELGGIEIGKRRASRCHNVIPANWVSAVDHRLVRES